MLVRANIASGCALLNPKAPVVGKGTGIEYSKVVGPGLAFCIAKNIAGNGKMSSQQTRSRLPDDNGVALTNTTLKFKLFQPEHQIGM